MSGAICRERRMGGESVVLGSECSGVRGGGLVELEEVVDVDVWVID